MYAEAVSPLIVKHDTFWVIVMEVCMCLDSLNGWKSLASAMLNKELKPRVPTANSQICSRDLSP